MGVGVLAAKALGQRCRTRARVGGSEESNGCFHVNTLLSSEHTCVSPSVLSLTLTLIQGAAVVVGSACWLMLLPMPMPIAADTVDSTSSVSCDPERARHERDAG